MASFRGGLNGSRDQNHFLPVDLSRRETSADSWNTENGMLPAHKSLPGLRDRCDIVIFYDTVAMVAGGVTLERSSSGAVPTSHKVPGDCILSVRSREKGTLVYVGDDKIGRFTPNEIFVLTGDPGYQPKKQEVPKRKGTKRIRTNDGDVEETRREKPPAPQKAEKKIEIKSASKASIYGAGPNSKIKIQSKAPSQSETAATKSQPETTAAASQDDAAEDEVRWESDKGVNKADEAVIKSIQEDTKKYDEFAADLQNDLKTPGRPVVSLPSRASRGFCARHDTKAEDGSPKVKLVQRKAQDAGVCPHCGAEGQTGMTLCKVCHVSLSMAVKKPREGKPVRGPGSRKNDKEIR